MASTEHSQKNVTNATSQDLTNSVEVFSEIQSCGLIVDDSTCLTNDGVDVDHESTVAHDGGIATDQPIICVICLELVEQETVALPCRHNYFHFSCLATWLQQNRSCPLCKTEILSVQYDGGKLQSTSLFHLPSSAPLQASQGQPHRPTHPHPRYRSNYARRSTPSVLDDADLRMRRRVYELQLFSLYVGNNRVSQYRNITPAIFRSDSTLIPRAKRWIRRELRAVDPFEQYATSHRSTTTMSRNSDFRNNEFLLEYIIAILRHIDLKGSAGQAEILLREHLGFANSRLFLHELENWLRSPFERLDDWDNYVQYSEV